MPKTTTSIPASLPDPGEELVDLLIPGASPEDRPVFLGVNGASIRVRPGETVRVRRKYAEVWAAAQAQERAALESRRRAQDASLRAMAAL